LTVAPTSRWRDVEGRCIRRASKLLRATQTSWQSRLPIVNHTHESGYGIDTGGREGIGNCCLTCSFSGGASKKKIFFLFFFFSFCLPPSWSNPSRYDAVSKTNPQRLFCHIDFIICCNNSICNVVINAARYVHKLEFLFHLC